MFEVIAAVLILAFVCAVWATTCRVTISSQNVVGNSGGSVTLGGVAYDTTAEECVTIDLSISANSTDFNIACPIDISELSAIHIEVSQDMTLQTNDGATPDDTFALKAARPFTWQKNTGVPNPFTVDVTDLYVTNTTAGTFKAFIWRDATP